MTFLIKLTSGLLALIIGLFSPRVIIPSTKVENPTPVSVNSKLPKEFGTGPNNEPKVALTFDADMTASMKKRLEDHKVETWYNRAVIDVLEKTHTPATLFLTGMWVEIYHSEAKLLAENPLFEIGSHSYSHPAFSWPCYTLRYIGQKEKEVEIDKTQAILKSIGVNNKLFRFPGGCHSQSDSALVNSRGLAIVNWDVASTDAFNPSTDKIIKRVLSKVKNGSIIVFHLNGGPNAPQTAEALKTIIPALKNRGFSFVKISDFFSQTP